MKSQAKLCKEAEFTVVNEHSEQSFNNAIQSAIARYLPDRAFQGNFQQLAGFYGKFHR